MRDEGLLKLFFSELVAADQLAELVRRRREWYERSAAMFRELGVSSARSTIPRGACSGSGSS